MKKIQKVLVIGIGTIISIGLILCVLCGLILSKIICPNNYFAKKYDVKGVDISHYQGDVDMHTLEAQDLQFVFMKATEGSSAIDKNFNQNWNAASQTKMFSGAYHFFSFDSTGKAQAAHYINTVGDLSGRLLPVVDIEYYGNKEKNPPKVNEVREQLQDFLTTIEEEYQVKPIIYTTLKVYYRYIKDAFENYPLWIRNVYYSPNLDMKSKWEFWQYCDTAILDGYKGEEEYIDLNVFKYSKKELQEKYVIQN